MDTTSPLTAERDPREVVAEQIKRETISNALAPTVAATLTTNPDQEAELNRMSRQAGLPRVAVEADKEEVARRIKLEAMGLDTMPTEYPALAESLTDPNFAALAHDDIDNLRRLHSAIDFTRQPSTQSSTFDSMAANFSMQNADMALIAYAFGHGDSASVANYVAGENRVLEQIQKNSPAYVRQLEQDKQQADGLGGYALAYLQNPRASGRAALESLAGSAYTLGGTMIGAGGGAAAGSAVPGIGTAAGGVAGMAVGTATMSAIQNSAAWLRQRLQEQNVNLSDPIAVKSALDNPELVAEIKAEAVRKGVVQGVLDGMFAVVGGKLATAPLSGAAGRVLSGTAGRVAGRAAMVAGDVLVQSAGGAGSEAAGQIAARGYADPKDVVDEFVLGTFSEGADTAIGAAVRAPSFLQNRGVVNAAQVVANEHRAQVDQLHAAAAGAKTRERDPEAVRAMVARQDPAGEVFIQPDVAKTYFQSLPPEQKTALTQAIPDIEQRIENAVEAGADVVLPKSDYVAHIAAMPEAEFLKDHVKFYADDQTVAEIMSDDRLRQMQSDMAAMGNRQDDIEQFQSRLKNELLDTGRVHGNRVVNALSDIYGAYFNRLRVDNVSDEVISKAMGSLEVIGPDAKPRPRVVTESDAQIGKLRDYVMDNDKKAESNRKRYETRLAEYQRRVREDFGGNEGNAQLAGVKRPKYGTGGKRTVKYPILNYLRQRGGIHPDGELAAFLRGEDVTPNKMPSLFNRKERSAFGPGGIMSGDDIPISEFEDHFGGKVSVPVEYGEAYGRNNTREGSSVPTRWLHDAIRSELLGDPIVQEDTDPETEKLEADAEYFDRLGIDVKTMTNEQIRAALAEANGDPVMGITTILYQSMKGEDGARGATKFTVDGRRIIQLFGSSNLSTFLHETGHAFLDIHASIAELENAPAKIKEDMDSILKFLGAENYASVTTEQHEKFARTFEAYLASGEAPSAGLHRAFRLFKSWLTQIYAALTGRYADVVKALDTEITPEIKAVFDRMLATDEEVEAVGKTFGHFLDEDVLAILPKADRDRYQRLHSQWMEQSKEKLLSKAIRQKERESAQWWKDERAKLHDDVEKSVNSDPVYRALHWLQKGQFLPGDEMAVPADSLKLSRQEVVKMFGREVASKLPSSVYAKKGGATIRPDTLADLVGFNIGNPLEGWRRGSGRELLLAMVNAEDRKSRIERLTDETMVERHGDIMMDGTIGDEAQAVAENDFQSMKIEMEGRAAAELAKLKFPSASNMKSAAQKMILEMKIQDAAAVDRFYRSALSSARLYGQAIKGKDWAKAVRYKRQQLLSHFLYREALEAREIRDKSLGVWTKYLGRKDEKLAKSNDMNFVYVARAILSKYGVLSFNQQWEEFVRKVEQYDPEAAQDLVQLANENTVGAMPWKVMTYSQFIGLRDTIDNILGVGRNSRFMEIDGQKRDRAEVRQELVVKLAERVAAGEGSGVSDGMSHRLTDKERVMLKLLGAKAMGRRVESWVKALDSGFGGVFRSYLWNPINNARDTYYEERHKVFSAAKEVIDPHKERLLNSGRIEAPELGYTFEDKGELLSAMLNSGNESNFERLIEGRKWTAAGWEKMIRRMESDGTIVKEDWELCADLAKVVKSLLPGAQKAHKAMYGYYFSEVQPWDIPTSFGTYTGWYWPVVYDRELSIQARTFAEGDVLKENNISMFPSTGKGFTQKRVANSPKEPIQLGLNVLSSHIDKVLRFTHLEPAVKDAAKLINHPDFKNAVSQYDPKAWENMLMPWLQRVASQSVELRGKGVEHARIWRTIRHNTSMQTMMLNLLNAMQQVTGFSQSIYAVGPRNMGKALMSYMSNPRQLFSSMNEASTFMRHRSTVLADHVESQVTDVLINKGRMATVRDAAVRHGYIFQRVVQGFVDTVTWTAAMEKATAGGMDVDEAVRYADSVVRETQGSNDPTDISTIEASSPFGRMFTMFYTYFNTQANSMLTEVANLRREYSGRELAGRTFYLYMMFVAIPAFAAEAIVKTMKGQLPEDDDDDGTVLDDYLAWFLGSQVRYATAMIPFAGQVLNAVYGAVSDDNPFNDRMTGSPVVSTIQAVPDAAKETARAFEGKGDLSRWVQRNLTAIGMLTGLPLGQAGKPLGYVADMLEGDTAPEGPVDLVRGVVAGPPPANRQ